MKVPQLFSNKISPNEAGGLAGGGYAALQAAPSYYKQMQESKFMGPLLQALLAQKQQKALQMMAATPFAAQHAQNAAIGSLPSWLPGMLESKFLTAKYPIAGNIAGGFLSNNLRNFGPAPVGTVPGQPLPLGATQLPTAPNRMNATTLGTPPAPPTQTAPVQTWEGTALKDFINAKNRAEKSIFGSGKNIPMPSDVISSFVKKNNLKDLKDIGNGWWIARKNGKAVRFQIPGVSNE